MPHTASSSAAEHGRRTAASPPRQRVVTASSALAEAAASIELNSASSAKPRRRSRSRSRTDESIESLQLDGPILKPSTAAIVIILTVLFGTAIKLYVGIANHEFLAPSGLLYAKSGAGYVGITPNQQQQQQQQQQQRSKLPYFANKNNVLNTMFVKMAWMWTTVAILPYATIVLSRVADSTQSISYNIRKVRNIALRWVAATAYWYLMTQWCFGPPIFDRIFSWSGGACHRVSMTALKPGIATLSTAGGLAGMGTLDIVHSYGCRRAGGRWFGGHDVSGHCFLLTHALMYMYEEVSPYLFNPVAYRRYHASIPTRLWGAFLTMIMMIWYWMLFMTAVYFHDTPEKFFGTTIGILYWFVTYRFILPNISFPSLPIKD
ncbi:hypothetical protein GQ42DRAFT_162011 [Ramicandelaber brevisporus]|nr:hypothetical protein GQ42DRAFT_162011 [Ramicandelaber brevisporus]